MKQWIACVLIFCLASVAVATTVAPQLITKHQIEAVAGAVAAESVTPAAAKSSKAGTWTAVLLAIVVVGGILYLVNENQKDHGGEGLLSVGAHKAGVTAAAASYQHAFLRQQWQTR